MQISHLKVNHLSSPLGFDLGSPVFSWIVSGSPSPGQRCARIRVFREEDCIWDTGEDPSADSLGTQLPIPLAPRTRYTWSVTVRGELGDEGSSEAAWFETGKLDEPWIGRWIRSESEELGILEKRFTLAEAPESARLYLSGLGLYRAYVNGCPVSDEVLAPGFHAYDRWMQAQTYDVGSLLRTGENRLEIWLGGGISRGRFSFTQAGDWAYCPYDCAVGELHLACPSGQRVIPTDESWRWRTSPILESSIYDGESWDPGRETREGMAVLCEPPVGPLRDRLSPPVRILEERKPLRLLRTPKGETVLDMGQNMVGWLRFPVRGERGSVLHLQFGEQLENGCFSRANLRTAKAAFTWRCDGEDRVAEPMFTWYGFRYVLLEGFEEDVDPAAFTGCVVSSDLETVGRVETGHAGLNRLFENVRWSQKGNFLDVPTDCPQRDEREGWTGDAQVFADTACFNRDCAAFYVKYLADMLEEQKRANGCVPYVVPFARYRSRGFEGGAVGWGDAASVIPWTLWLHYGDRSLLRRQLENMVLWMEWVARQENWSQACRHFGDWLALDRPEDPGERVGKTEIPFLCLCYACYSASLTAQAAAVLGEETLVRRAEELAENNRKELLERYFDGNGELLCETQTACVLVLHLGLAPDEARIRRLLEGLVRRDGHLTTGFLGTPWLLDELPTELAWDLLLREDYPSWLYEVKLGATTVWERWNSLTPEGCFSETGMNSLNHYAYGSVAAWYYRRMCGIEPLAEGPGFRRFRWAPQPDRRAGYARAELMTPCGRIRSAWRYEGEKLLLSLTVPFGSTALVRLPDGREGELPAGNYVYRIPAPVNQTEQAVTEA